MRLAPVALAPFAQELEARFRPAAAAAGVKLSHAIRGTSVITDARLLNTIASNLVSNAIRYTPAGGHVEIALRQHRGGLVLAVRDSGAGIAPQHQQRIFERLYRIDETRDRATGGSGLGLAIAHRAAQTLGGHIELESTPGQGSDFRLVLPPSRGPAQREARESDPQLTTRRTTSEPGAAAPALVSHHQSACTTKRETDRCRDDRA